MLRPVLRRLAVVAILVLAILRVPAAPAAHAAGTFPFALTITHVECVDDCDETGLEAALEGHADFYAKVWINGVKQPPGSNDDDPSTPRINNNPSIDPHWVIPAQIPDSIQNVPVSIQIWDQDDTSGDDLGDVSPRDSDNTLDFWVNRVTGKWVDPRGNEDRVNWPQSCSIGDGGDNDEPRVKVCFDVTTDSTSGDADGDGLLDGWERNGYSDGGNTIDVDLPAMGAKVNHKDIFLELDWQAGRPPSRQGIQAMKKAFAAAPPGAGSRAGERLSDSGRPGMNAPPNGDGPGITLHVDTGVLVDTTARKGAPTGSCSDGVDNGGDGVTDGNDPDCNVRLVNYLDSSVEDPGVADCTNADTNNRDCLVGDNLGGGGVIVPAPGVCGIGPAFNATKAANFNPVRRNIFHYAFMAALPAGCAPTGGQGDIGGANFVVFNTDAGSIMHELGHNLNLRHGGFQDTPNCQPNYVSLMNYDNQGGISRVGGGFILDYSPPRISYDGKVRGTAPLPTLVENNLTEPTTLDPADPNNQFRFTDARGRKVPSPLNTPPDWTGDGADPPYDPVPPVNLDTVGLNGRPPACANPSTNETLTGADDWSFVSLSFHQFSDSASDGGDVNPGPVNDELSPTTEDLLALDDEVNTTDVAVAASDQPDPVAAGTDFSYTLTATNRGPRPATAVILTNTLPAQVSVVSVQPACHVTGGDVTCGLGQLAQGASRTVTITVHVPADLASHGGPVTLTNRATVDNVVGPDPVPDNDSVTENTTVIAVADLALADLTAVAPPTQVVIGQTIPVTLHDTVSNGGPSTPIDATVVTTITPDTGATSTPASSTRTVSALAAGAPRSTTTTFTVSCQRPGMHTYRFTETISPAHSGDVDPQPANNARQVQFTLDCVVPVAINIRPGVNPNWVNIPLDVVPVAVLTTRAGEYGLPLAFDATAIQPQTVHFGPSRVVYPDVGGSPPVAGQGTIVDSPERGPGPVEPVVDLDLDMMFLFTASTSGLTQSDTEACVKGSYVDRATGQTYRFIGCDAVRIVRL
jgi:uncharacterized repeat protein (TIGR01451 family)